MPPRETGISSDQDNGGDVVLYFMYQGCRRGYENLPPGAGRLPCVGR